MNIISIAVKAQMNLRVRTYSMGCGGMLPPKIDFYIVCGVFWGVFYNSFSQLFYQNFIRLA